MPSAAQIVTVIFLITTRLSDEMKSTSLLDSGICRRSCQAVGFYFLEPGRGLVRF
jgi:hypothetical protein